ncbi:hypothetical protein BDV09DRAFT_196682 [Aspergillus tetrazonus]
MLAYLPASETGANVDPNCHLTGQDKPKRVVATSRADTTASSEAGSPTGFTYAAFNRHVCFCDTAFVAKSGDLHGYATLADVVSSNKYPTAGAQTDPLALTSLSATLYHELFHLTDSDGTDSDGSGLGYYFARDIMRLSWNSRSTALLIASEPYVFFSWVSIFSRIVRPGQHLYFRATWMDTGVIQISPYDIVGSGMIRG